MTPAQWIEWVSQHWAVISGMLTLLLISVPTVWMLWQREKREAQQQEANRQESIAQAENLYAKAKKTLDLPPPSFEDEDEGEEDPEAMILLATEKYAKVIGLTSSRKQKGTLWFKVGRCYELINWLHEAEQAYNNATANWSKHPFAWYKLAEMQWSIPEKQDLAIVSLQHHLKRHPSDEKGRWLLETMAEQSEDTSRKEYKCQTGNSY